MFGFNSHNALSLSGFKFAFGAMLLFALMGAVGCSDDKDSAHQTKEGASKMSSKGDSRDSLPNVVILATGGTIAGSVDSQIKTTGYTAGVVGIDTLINAVPQITQIAHIQGEQLANIDSADMSDEIWLKLAHRANELLTDKNIDGIVITHGTDTMEETAFFLHLVLKSDKPVVLVGAMRPSSALSADGPKNLYNAVALASHPDSKGKGVMVAMNDRIQSARFVSKIHALNVEAFASPNAGDMGYILDGRVFFNYSPTYPHTKQSVFDVKDLESLPRVDILYSYANDGSAVAAKALQQTGAKGIIIAGTGAGSIHKDHKETLKSLTKEGLIIVQSSRVNAGLILANEADSKEGFIGAKDLNPQKARVLLMLALTQSEDFEHIAHLFDIY